MQTCVGIHHEQNDKVLAQYIHGRNPKLVDPLHEPDLTLQVFLGPVRPPTFIHNIGCGQEKLEYDQNEDEYSHPRRSLGDDFSNSSARIFRFII